MSRRLRQNTSCLLNRSAIVIRPLQPFLDWVHEVVPTSQSLGFADLYREPNVYLLPETTSPEDADRLVQRCFGTIFEAELGGWFRDPSDWPTKQTFRLFRAWFEYTYHSMLFDLAENYLSYD